MNDIRVEPVASQLLESMRSIGYSCESAVADLIDNSITAEARNIDIVFPAGRPTYVAVVDDGYGMTGQALIEAMRHGSRSPREERALHDLGRFGLGLKTASLSQCRCLTVMTKRNGQISACRWSIDHVAKTGDWMLQILDAEEIRALPAAAHLQNRRRGTIVLWEDLDQLALGDRGDGAVLSRRIDSVRDHLALVFHRYLTGESELEAVRIAINGNPIEPLDPFLSAYRAGGQKSPVEKFQIEGATITVQAHTLPHISRLTNAQIKSAGGAEGLRRLQGFYIYRNRRLIVWGTWFRLYRQEELSKLTRVQVDIPNSIDHLWALDIRKSAASPPEVIRDRLKALVPTMIGPSVRVQEHRAKIRVKQEHEPLWHREELRDGSIRYIINREHPVVATLKLALGETEQRSLGLVLRAIEEAFPGEAFYNDRANERIGFRGAASEGSSEAVRRELEELAWYLFDSLKDQPEARRRLVNKLHTIDPFVFHPDITEKIRERLENEA